MDDTALRKQCEAVQLKLEDEPRYNGGELIYPNRPTEILLAFAKRQRAAGLREAKDSLYSQIKHPYNSTDDDVWAHFQWCEARAKAWEEGV